MGHRRKKHPLFDFFHWVGSHESATLMVLAGVVAGVWAFAEIADDVMENSTRDFDQTILLAMRTAGDAADPLGPGWLEEFGRDMTALGGVGVLTLFSLAVVGYLLLSNKGRAALVVIVSIAGGVIISLLLKDVFDRPRPDLVPHGSIVYTKSFPSGHSMMSAVVYLTLAALLARVEQRKRIKAYVLLIAVITTTLVGVSRVYLGVHWPTDVLAGWTAGAVWALCCWLLARWLQQRGQMEGGESHSGGQAATAD